MDGTETAYLEGPDGMGLRVLCLPHSGLRQTLEDLAEKALEGEPCAADWYERLQRSMAVSLERGQVWPVGQDAALASGLGQPGGSVVRILRRLRAHVERTVSACSESHALAPRGPLAAAHGTEFPIVQGPMTRVSDIPEFCGAVAAAGGLPCLALSLMEKDRVRDLLEKTRMLMGDRPWAVGVLGFAPETVRQKQFEAIVEARPAQVIIAGGLPSQAAPLEKLGISTYLHVPSPRLLVAFLAEGARRFVFEGCECGGHVGPRSSFLLWESMVRVLLEAGLDAAEAAKVHLLFAGGVHDGLSAAMVAALAQPLVDQGMKIGVLMGTAYLFTEEVVATGGVVPAFQQVAVEARGTALVQSGPGHVIRCARTPFVRFFDGERRRLRGENRGGEEIRRSLEELSLGRLRIASKGIVRGGDAAPADTPYRQVDERFQLAEGLYMMGQVAALHSQPMTIRRLHEQVCQGAVEQLRKWRKTSVEVKPREPAAAPSLAVAIVGMGCVLPGAAEVAEFWRNILDKRDCVTEVPDDRFDVRRWFDGDRRARDKMYSRWGGFIAEVPFDPLQYGLPPKAVPSIEPAQLLALELVEQSLRDAGYDRDNPFRLRTSVILGAGGGMGELGTRYAVRAMLPEFIANPGASLWDHLPEWTEDSFAGILLNVISGRVSNRLDFAGVNYTVDAACASSLAAVYLGCRELTDGTSDLVIAGGVDTMQHPFSYLAFSKTQALSPTGRSRPFDASADGIVISEGLAAVVLKRLDDAERDGDRIYAVIRGLAGGSDGRHKSITAPSPDGQRRMLERAYAQARFSPATCDLFEAHGTGTTLGDVTECQCLGEYLRGEGAAQSSIALGSVKSMIGHTKSTAGAASLIKVALSLFHRVLPPTLHVQQPNPKAGLGDGPLYVNTEVRPWIRQGHPRRAGVSAFGFGGTNFHAVLEEYEGSPSDDLPPAPGKHRSAELFVFSGASREGLAAKVEWLADRLHTAGTALAGTALADLAFSWHAHCGPVQGPVRAAVVSEGVPQLQDRLRQLADCLRQGAVAGDSGVYFVDQPLAASGRVAVVFPGQGSQVPNMLRELAVEFRQVAAAFERADRAHQQALPRPLSCFIFPPPAFTQEGQAAAAAALNSTDITQPALAVCEVAMWQLLQQFGLRADVTAGHSFGELVALHAAGCLDEPTLFETARRRGEAIVAIQREGQASGLGEMLAVLADASAVEHVLSGLGDVWLSNRNSPTQTTISGTSAGIAQARTRLEAAGLKSAPIRVRCAFHSPLMFPARERFLKVLDAIDIAPPRWPVYANLTADVYPAETGEIRRILADQLVHGVRFQDEIRAMHAAGARMFIEAGPGDVLTKLIGQTLQGMPHVCVATQSADRPGVAGLLHALAALFAHGLDVHLDHLYEGRPVVRLDLRQLGEIAGKPLRSGIWLVNGAYARPAGQPPRRTEPAVRLVTPEVERLAGPQAGPGIPLETEPAAAAGAAPPTLGSAPDQEYTVGPRIAEQVFAPSGLAAFSAEDAAMFAKFQETMQQFLETQRTAIEVFLGGRMDGHAARDTARPALADVRRFPGQVEPGGVTGEPATSGEPDLLEPPAAQSAGGPVAPAAGSEAALPAGPSRPEAASPDALRERLLAIVSERTGYPPEALNPAANIEAELGIDSIKRTEILSAFRQDVWGPSSARSARSVEELSRASTLNEIVAVATKALASSGAPSGTGPAGGDQAAAAAPGVPSGEEFSPAEKGAMRERTDYPVEAPRTVAPAREAAAERRREPRCRAVVVELPVGDGSPTVFSGGAFVMTNDGRGVARRLRSDLEACGARVAMVPPEALLSREAVAAEMGRIRSEHGELRGLLHLLPLQSGPSFPHLEESEWWERVYGEVRGLLLLIQGLEPELKRPAAAPLLVAAASLGGGDFGAIVRPSHPWRGGLAGLLRAAAAECRNARFRNLNFAELPDRPLLPLLAAEFAARGPVDVAYSAAGRRFAIEAVREELPAALPARPAIELTPEGVILVLGGARGITAAVARQLAEFCPARFVLVGRSRTASPEDDTAHDLASAQELRQQFIAQLQSRGEPIVPREVEARVQRVLSGREIQATLASIAKAGASVEYLRCDVQDSSAFADLVCDVQRRTGPIQAVIHGAGLIEDRLLLEKSSASFDRVLGTKLCPVLTLARHLDPQRLKMVMFFSSIAGFFGNPGQADYGAANEILNRLASRLVDLWPGKIVSMNWGPWAGAGMVTPELARQMQSRGIGLVSIGGGQRAALDEFLYQAEGDVRVLIGAGPWLEEADRLVGRRDRSPHVHPVVEEFRSELQVLTR
jgi:acyl transferase domain-containing protein/NAD(P)H-dependent flavin oxidoreductase YrpB (nitropropane dioxygenase family)/NAD(P)-dependent dehydrogenase (short-subunit alcohol dehydrogenase family)